MRELKFRAYIKPLKRYATGLDTIQFHKCCDVAGAGIWTVVTVNEGIFEGDDIVLEQDTGLKDKNGKEIYEGDIVKSKKGQRYGFVEYIENDGGFMIWWTSENEFIYLGEAIRKYEDLEVIGNIHENSELLGGEK